MENDKFNDGFSSIDTTTISDAEESNESVLAAVTLGVTAGAMFYGTALATRGLNKLIEFSVSKLVDGVAKLITWDFGKKTVKKDVDEDNFDLVDAVKLLAKTQAEVENKPIQLPFTIKPSYVKAFATNGKMDGSLKNQLNSLLEALKSFEKVNNAFHEHYSLTVGLDKDIVKQTHGKDVSNEKVLALVTKAYAKVKNRKDPFSLLSQLKEFGAEDDETVKYPANDYVINTEAEAREIFDLMAKVFEFHDKFKYIPNGDHSDGEHDYLQILEEEDAELWENWINAWDHHLLFDRYDYFAMVDNYANVINTIRKVILSSVRKS